MFWRKKRSFSDFAEEIQSHLAHEADEVADRRGLHVDKEAQARRTFGNITATKERFYEYRRWLWWDQLSREVNHALRLFWQRPGFSAVVVLTLTVGIGATLAIFTVVNAVLLRSLPYNDPSRLAMLWTENSTHSLAEGRVSLLNFADWKKRNHSFEDMTLFIGQTFLLENKDGTRERMRSARISANFFPLLGVEPSLGRVFSAEEEKRGEAVVVITNRLWQQRFGGSMNALGADLLMDGRKSRVIGVMPANFQYPFADTQVWEPITAHRYWASRDRINSRAASNWYALARLRRGVQWTEAQSEMSVIARQMAAEYPENRVWPEIRVVPLDVQTSGRLRLPLFVLFSSVVLLLLIACLNVANLLLARGSAREREFAVRRALGASGAKILTQLLAESLVFSFAGGALGSALAFLTLKALIAFGPRDIPRLTEAHIDGPALLFTLALSLFAAVFSGLWPAMRNNTSATRGRSWTTVPNRRLRDLIVVGEFAIALALVAGAGLMVRSLVRLESVDLGFRPENLLIMRIDLHVGRTSAQQVAYFREAIDRVSALPGVRSAAAVSGFLLSDPEDAVEIEGRPPQQPGPSDDLVAGPYFQTAGIPLKRGRCLSDRDRSDSLPVAVINEQMARLYWPNEDPVGKRFRFPSRSSKPWVTVVGVSGNMRRQGIEKQAIPQVFRPDAQQPEDMMELIVRTAGNPDPIAATVRNEIQSLDRSVPKFDVSTVERQLGEQTAERNFQTSLILIFSAVALLLSAIGIYGLMHYFVVERTHEIGVRVALGARYGNVLAMVVSQGLALAGFGIGLGVLLALCFTHLLTNLLYGVTPTDPVTFAIAPAILLAVAALASWLPARRAARIDPMLALRQD
jgi:predicted permease